MADKSEKPSKADKSEKPSKADKILDVMDDLSAAVDDFAARLQALERLFDTINNSLVSIYNRVDEMESKVHDTQRFVMDTQTTVMVMNDWLEYVAKISETLEKNFQDFQEVADEMRSRQRQEQLFEARAAMGKVKFISMRA